MNLPRAAIYVAPAVAFGIGVWAEFAHLTPAVLFAVSLPAIIVSTLAAASMLRPLPWPAALVLAGAVVGVITFGIAEPTHVAIHEALGRSLDFGGRYSEAAKAFALIGIHLGAGAMIGAGVGTALATLSVVLRLRSIAPTLRFALRHSSPSARERGRG